MDHRLDLTFMGGAAGARLVDAGRAGLSHFAIPRGGPADNIAYAELARSLGHAVGHPAVEVPLRGGKWQLKGSGYIAVGGTGMNWRLDATPIKANVVYTVTSGGELTGSYSRSGVYGYFSVAGKWSVPTNLGSVMALLPQNGVLRAGFSTHIRSSPQLIQISEVIVATPPAEKITVYQGPESRHLSHNQLASIYTQFYTVHPQSNRQGVRLTGNSAPLPFSESTAEMISSPVLPGTVQSTPSGLIVLGPDAQTIGGYPRIGWLDEAARSSLFQRRPGATVNFTYSDEPSSRS